MCDQSRLSGLSFGRLCYSIFEFFTVCLSLLPHSTSIQRWSFPRRIEYEFGQFGPFNESYYGYFNATLLNDAAGAINNAIASNHPAASGFLFATLPVLNASGASTADSGLQADSNDTTSTSNDNDNSSNDTGVAM